MTTTIKSGQVAKVEIKDLKVSPAYTSLYEDWRRQGHTGSFDDFLATLRPEIDDAALRRLIEDVLAGRSGQPVDISRDHLAELVSGLIPARLIDSNAMAAQLKTLLSEHDFGGDPIAIKPGRAISKQEFDEWRVGVTFGQVVVQATNQTLVINDWFTPEMQADVLSESPKLIHSRAIYDILKERAKPGMHIRMFGRFNMAKLDGVEPELFGADGRTPDAPTLARVINGAQPTMILHFDGWDVDFSQCRFIVQTMMTDGFAIAGYKGANRFKPGQWITKTIQDIDPERKAAGNWRLLGGKNGVFPPIDGTTGFAAKGYDNAGFNTTTRHKWCGCYRSNSLDTSTQTSGGYGGQFPQADGSTAATWGVWKDGGMIGNMGSGGHIFQTPAVGKTERESASMIIDHLYARGFISYGFETGLEAKPSGDVFANSEEMWEYVPQNVWLMHAYVEDCYEGGIQAHRFVNLWEMHSRCYRMGHPDCDFTYYKPGTSPAAFINDPGYGTSSRRQTPQINRYIIGGWYIDCARKGIDAHTLGGLYISNVKIKSMIWGIQICFDEIYTTPNEPSPSATLSNQFTLRDTEIFANLKGLDFTNGSFGSDKHIDRVSRARLFEMRFKAMVDNVQIFAPIGVFDNYGRGNVLYRGVSATCDYPYGKPAAFNTATSCGFWLGSQNPTAYGIPFNVKLENCEVKNSPKGNYAESYRLLPINLLVMRDCMADITPFITDAAAPTKYLRGENVMRSGMPSQPFAVADAGGVKLQNALFDNCLSIDKSSGVAITRFTYQQDEPVAVPQATVADAMPSTPSNTASPEHVVFSLSNATGNSAVSDDGSVAVAVAGVTTAPAGYVLVGTAELTSATPTTSTATVASNNTASIDHIVFSLSSATGNSAVSDDGSVTITVAGGANAPAGYSLTSEVNL